MSDIPVGGSIEIFELSASEENNEICIHVSVKNPSGCERKVFPILCEMWDKISLDLSTLPVTVDADTLCEIEELASLAYAVRKAYRSVSFSPCSERMLARKLCEKGVNRQIAAEAARFVKAKGYIDEEKCALREAELCLKKYWGKSRIMLKLRERGYCDEAVDTVAEYLDGIDFSERCLLYLEKKYKDPPADGEDLKKVFAALARYGYSMGEIKTAMRKFSSL